MKYYKYTQSHNIYSKVKNVHISKSFLIFSHVFLCITYSCNGRFSRPAAMLIINCVTSRDVWQNKKSEKSMPYKIPHEFNFLVDNVYKISQQIDLT